MLDTQNSQHEALMTLEVKAEVTRNPDLVTFRLNKTLIPPGTGLSFSGPEYAKDHPLANALFQIRGVKAVWILGNDVQVTKDENVRWGTMTSRIIETIKRIEG
ncbi:hypothetical protein NITGR_490015 [Nitrospina gracilis 3/211]|uniref:Scaffold protein Nfu/NifU N-terminal domain-containing protein n=1 Tax=Nitrospina gracilis (strain 3/211) TaxID=1266370 RepID=M1YYW3_NITG3|nr:MULTISPECIES: NifU N-terminal domain-containing protein [Nitrospina]MCF8723805.1 hypothetical protein [Nitrospina sp. Nb-3]CCQ90912.1 hypothetical protein NITGR_490015 [Nitrospina gracilis 3/211]